MDETKFMPKRRFENYKKCWHQKVLKDIKDVRDGTHESPKYYEDGYPFITSKNVSDGYINYNDIQYISKQDFEHFNMRSKVSINDILMGMIGTVGNIALIREEPEFAIKNVALIKDGNQTNQIYLYYFFQSNYLQQQLLDGLDGGTQKFISLFKIRNLLISIPTVKEQQKIGEFFKVLDERIANQKRKIAKVKALKAAYLTEMFPQEGETIPKRRFRGFEGEWKKDTFKKLLKTHSFNTYLAQPKLSGKYEVIQQGDVPIIGYSNIPAFKEYRNVVLFGDHTLSLFRPTKSFLIATDGVKILEIEGVFNSFLFVLLTKYLPKSEGYKRHFTILKNQFCLMPENVEEQQKIGAFFKNLDNQIETEEKKLDKLQKMKEAYLEEMFV